MLKEKKKVKNTTPEEEKIKKWEMIPLNGEDYRNSSYKVFSLGDDVLMMILLSEGSPIFYDSLYSGGYEFDRRKDNHKSLSYWRDIRNWTINPI